jgi:type I restriction enzyme M protein
VICTSTCSASSPRRHQRAVPHAAAHHRADGGDDGADSRSDEICDPACGTAGFLVAASEYVREQHPSALTDARQRKHFHSSMFHGYDFDSTMLRIGSMNMLLHGVESPTSAIATRSPRARAGDAESYTLILANPPFAGSLDYEATPRTSSGS